MEVDGQPGPAQAGQNAVPLQGGLLNRMLGINDLVDRAVDRGIERAEQRITERLPRIVERLAEQAEHQVRQRGERVLNQVAQPLVNRTKESLKLDAHTFKNDMLKLVQESTTTALAGAVLFPVLRQGLGVMAEKKVLGPFNHLFSTENRSFLHVIRDSFIGLIAGFAVYAAWNYSHPTSSSN